MKRPFTPQELQNLAAKGYDISSYRGEAVEFPDPPPPPEEKHGALKAGGRSALVNALPTAAGGAGFGLTMLALAPETMGASLLAIPAAAAVGYGASKLTGMGQEKLMSDEFKQQIALDQQQHPTASFVGGAATLPFGGFNPNVMNVARAAGAIPQLIGGAATKVGRQALVNVGSGAALGGIQEAVIAPIEGREITAGNVARQAAIGALFNDPNVIGKGLYKFQGSPNRVVDDPNALANLATGRDPVAEQPKTVKPTAKETAVSDIEGAAFQKDKEGLLAKGAAIERKDHPELTSSIPGAAEQIAKDELKLDPKAYEGESVPKTPAQQFVMEKASEKGINLDMNQALHEVLKEEVAKPHNVEQVVNPALESKGKVQLDSPVRTTELGPNATIDTPVHELSHILYNESVQAAKAGDTKAQKWLDQMHELAAPGLEEFNKQRIAAGKEPMNMEEFVVSELGYEFVNRQLNLRGEGAFKQWLNDTKALLKSKYMRPTVEEAFRASNFRTVQGGGMGKYVGEKGPLGATGGTSAIELGSRQQGDSEKLVARRFIDDSKNPSWQYIITKTPNEKANAASAKFRGTYFEKVGPGEWKVDHHIERNSIDELVSYLHAKEISDWNKPYGVVKFKEIPYNKPSNRFQAEGEGLGNEVTKEQLLEEPKAVTGKLEMLDVKPVKNDLEESPFGRNQPNGEGLSGKYGFLKELESSVDRMERIDKDVAQAGRNMLARKDQYWGKAQAAESELSKFKDDVVNNTVKKLRKIEDGAKITLNGMEQEAAAIWKKYMDWNVDTRRENGQQIEGREAGKKAVYVPDMLNEQWIHTFTEKPNSPEARHGKRLWADWIVRASAEGKNPIDLTEAMKHVSDYIDAMGSPSGHYTTINFGAMRKAEGYGLPEGMRETSAKKILVKYGRRAAADMAFFKEIENRPEIASVLKIRSPGGELTAPPEGKTTVHTTQEAKDLMKWLTGTINQQSIEHPFITSASRLVNNSIMGPGTGLRDAASIPVFTLPFMNKFSDLGAFVKGVAEFRKNSKDALEYAATQPHIDKKQFNDIVDSPTKFIDLIQKTASFMRQVQGREFIENNIRDITFSIGKELAKNNVMGAIAGHKQSQQFLKRFGTLIEKDVTKLKGKELEEALNQMAKNFTDAVQGTYGGAGLPAWTTEGQLAPFLSLQKWSIEKSNIIWKDVVKPFYTGENRIPLLTYTLGSVLTGAGIQELNRMLTNRKASDPTWDEALEKKDATQIATLLQLASFGGIIGDSLKFASDAYKGKTPRNPLAYPAYSSAADMGEQIKNAVAAINDGEDAVDVLSELGLYLMRHNVQAARMAGNYLDSEESERADKFRDRRVFNELEGKPAGNIPTPNRYAGLAGKQYKQTGDLREAMQMLPSLIEQQKEKAQGNPEKLRRSLVNLSGNSYQTMPSPKDSPMEFRKYYDFLVATQGKEEADRRMADYMRQSAINRVKSSLIPRF